MLLRQLSHIGEVSLGVGKYSGGLGTEASPYLISTLDDLLQLSEYPLDNATYPDYQNDWDDGVYFLQTNNIDASDTVNWNSGTGFLPICFDLSRDFNANFNGANFNISNLYESHPLNFYVGMFGVVGTTGVVKNVNLTSVNITGLRGVGGLVGYVNGATKPIDNCFVSGTINSGNGSSGGLVGFLIGTITNSETAVTVNDSGSSTNYGIGGFVGDTGTYSTINDCKTTSVINAPNAGTVGGFIGNGNIINRCSSHSTVTGLDNVSGFCAAMYVGGGTCNDSYSTGSATALSGTVSGFFTQDINRFFQNCYSACTLSGTTVYGFSSSTRSANFTSCYYDSTLAGVSDTATATPKTTTEMKTQSTFVGWDFATLWGINTDEYPNLDNTFFGFYSGGSGSIGDPFLISSLNDLRKLSEYPLDNTSYPSYSDHWNSSYYFNLTDNIDAISTSSWNSGNGFLGIGNLTTYFAGTFNGNNYNINNVYINATSDYRGFFNVLSGDVSNLTLNNINVNGYSGITALGGFLGTSFTGSSLLGCSCNGVVNCSASNGVGGFIGFATGGSIDECNSNVNVDSSGNATSTYTGGFVGYVYEGFGSTISECYSKGTVKGDTSVGGFVGNLGDGCLVDNCYSQCNVESLVNVVGGFIGTHRQTASIDNCYSTGSITYVGANLGGFCGDNGEVGLFSNNFYDSDTSGLSDTVAAIPKTTLEMYDENTFINAGWDYSTIWATDPDIDDYPYLINNI